MSNVFPIRADETGYEDMPVVMSPKALADVLQVSVTTLARWREAKQGPAWHEPAGARMIRYSRVDVIAWLRGSTVTPKGRVA